jgi:hypothetical protein
VPNSFHQLFIIKRLSAELSGVCGEKEFSDLNAGFTLVECLREID